MIADIEERFIDENDDLTDKYNKDATEACHKWLKLRGQDLDEAQLLPWRARMIEFAQLLGYPRGSRLWVPIFHPEVRHLLDLINGPHGDTILRMLEVKRNARSTR